jgi:predicted transposase YbfD/YdcC
MIKNKHSRKDSQKIWVAQDLEWLEKRHEWKGLRTLVCVQREWSTNGVQKTEKRFYISSADKTAEEFGSLIRRHWPIENEYHWHLDVNFKEDDSEIAARSNKILRLARTIALQLLKAEPTQGMSIARKKKRCQRSISFLKSVLNKAKF